MANEIARRLRKTMTKQEVKLWVRLRELRALGLHFRRQSPIGRYIADFECRRAKLVIEIDGGQHAMDAHIHRDQARERALQQAGYRVIRFWNHEIDETLEEVVETIVEAARPAPHPAARVARGHPPLKGRD